MVHRAARVPGKRAQAREIRVRARACEDVDADLLPRTFGGYFFEKRIRGSARQVFLIRPRVFVVVASRVWKKTCQSVVMFVTRMSKQSE